MFNPDGAAAASEKISQIRQLEEISANAWAAPYSVLHDGWLVRYARGYTRRANSVLPLYPSAQVLDHKLNRCEAFYGRRTMPVLFKMTDAALPTELDDALANRGYRRIAATSVQAVMLTGSLPSVTFDDLAVDVRSYPSAIWLDTHYQLHHILPLYHDMIRRILREHVLQPAHFVMLWDGNQPIAQALLVIEQGYAGIFDVVVHMDYRRRGVGQGLMQYMLRLAHKNRAHTAYLQVMLNNEHALRLYEHLGFQEVYSYWYREKPLS